MSTQSVGPVFTTFKDVDGSPLESGYVYIGVAGLAPENNPISVYWDADFTTAATQPIRTAGGYPMNSGSPGELYITEIEYSITVNDKNNATVNSIATKTTDVEPTKFVRDFGAVGDGVTDDTAAITAAIASFSSGSRGTLSFEQGKTYAVTGNISNSNRLLIWDGNDATILLTASADYVLLIDGSGTTLQNLRFQKAVGAVGACIKVSGTRNRIDNCFSQDAIWTKFIHLFGCKSSVFTRIRVDNDVTSKTGDIFYLDYSVNNTITDCNLQYCATAIFASTLANPVGSTKSEGLTVTACVTALCAKAINCDWITALQVVGCVLDFNLEGGVWVTNGQTASVTNTWIANQVTSGAGYVAVNVNSNFDNFSITNNTIVGNVDDGIAIAPNGTNVKAIGNHVKSMPFGGINSTKGYFFGNTTDGVSTDPTGDGLYELSGGRLLVGAELSLGGPNAGEIIRAGLKEYLNINATGAALIASTYGDVPTYGEIFAHEKGTTNYILMTYFKRNTAAAPVVTTISNSVITFSSANAAGTVTLANESVTADLRFQAKISMVNNSA